MVFRSLNQRGRALEAIFFRAQSASLQASQKELEAMEQTEKKIGEISRIKNPEVLRKLVELKIAPDLLATLALVPLVEVAWADFEVQEKEREAILAAAGKSGFAKGSCDYTLLEQWLQKRPPAKLLDAWIQYVRGLCEVLSDPEREAMKVTLLGHAREVAEAAGGFLGLGNKVSDGEQAILDKMEKAFAARGAKKA
jgi:hypothetical protein